MPAKVDVEKCTGCESCVPECPSESIKMVDGKAVVEDTCVDCGVCVDTCPAEAISMESGFQPGNRGSNPLGAILRNVASLRRKSFKPSR